EVFGSIDVAVIPNPIEKVENEVEKSFDPIKILYIGRLEWYKGIHVLVEAFKNLKKDNLRLFIAGKGPEFEKIKKSSCLDKRIIFLGFVSEKKKQELLKETNLTVIPSLWCEPFPIIALESLASGTPIVASNIGGLPEIVKDGYNGKLFEPGNSKELRDVLEKLVSNEEELKRFQNEALESARYFQIKNHVDKLEKFYMDYRNQQLRV
ncbi:MAG: glycosyltransferase family 4 protein, partial [Leptospiraceae bacterium]|nr:glycosyltransferase family 4 protein [Leptospiraceae bacterium]